MCASFAQNMANVTLTFVETQIVCNIDLNNISCIETLFERRPPMKWTTDGGFSSGTANYLKFSSGRQSN